MRRPTPRLVPLAAAVLTWCLVAGCSGDGGGEPSSHGSATSPATAEPAEPMASEEAAPEVRTVSRKGQVTGRIGRGDRKDVVRRVAGVVDTWLEAAYVSGEYPRKASSYGAKAWPGFTQGAARTARAARDLMSNADIAERIDGVTVKRRRITVDVLAVGRIARAATARVDLAFRTEGLDRRVKVTGRVFLTKKNGRWKVFGYDVAKARV